MRICSARPVLYIVHQAHNLLRQVCTIVLYCNRIIDNKISLKKFIKASLSYKWISSIERIFDTGVGWL